jgi:hypothetical protein
MKMKRQVSGKICGGLTPGVWYRLETMGIFCSSACQACGLFLREGRLEHEPELFDYLVD